MPSGAPGTIPLTIVNTSGSPIQPSSNIEVYFYGQANGTLAWEGLNADGSAYLLPTIGSVVKPIPWLGGSGNSETLYLPLMYSSRIYIVDANVGGADHITAPAFEVTLAGMGPNAPAPWAKAVPGVSTDGSSNVSYDFVEYSEPTQGNVNVDTSQVDSFGLDLEVSVTGIPDVTTGFKSGAYSAFTTALTNLGSPWSKLIGQKAIINPQHGAVSSGASIFPSSTFLDSAIMTAWNTYKNGNWMEIGGLAATGYTGGTPPGTIYGTVDSNGNFQFYSAQSTSSTWLGTIESPQTFANANSGLAGDSVTMQVFAQDGVFTDFTTPYAADKGLGPAVGNRVSGALNSGVMAPTATPSAGAPLTVQPICDLTARFPGPTVAPYENQFAGALHIVANTYGYIPGAAYGYPYDDLCGTSSDTGTSNATQMTITINSQ